VEELQVWLKVGILLEDLNIYNIWKK